MSAIFSVIIILLFSNKDFVNRFVAKDKQTRSATKLFIDFTVYFAASLVIGTVIQYFLLKFILEPINLTSFLLLVIIGISVGLSILAEYLLRKLNKESLIIFNRYELSVLVFIGFVLTMQISGTIIGSLVLTLLNALGFFIVGIILIKLSEIIAPKIKLNDNIPIILITGSILLMVTTIL